MSDDRRVNSLTANPNLPDDWVRRRLSERDPDRPPVTVEMSRNSIARIRDRRTRVQERVTETR